MNEEVKHESSNKKLSFFSSPAGKVLLVILIITLLLLAFGGGFAVSKLIENDEEKLSEKGNDDNDDISNEDKDEDIVVNEGKTNDDERFAEDKDCGEKTYTYKTFDKFSFQYSTCDWLLTETTEKSSYGDWGNVNIKLQSKIEETSYLEIRLQPIGPTGFGPGECSDAKFEILKGNIGRIKRSADEYYYSPTIYLEGSQEYSDIVEFADMNGELGTGSDFCSITGSIFTTSTNISTPDLGQLNGFVTFNLYTIDSEVVKKADDLVLSAKF